VKGGHGWASLMLSCPGAEEGRGFEEAIVFFCLKSFAYDFEYSIAGRHVT